MRPSTVGAPVLAAVALLLVARCTAADPPPHPAAAHPVPSSTAAGAVPDVFNATDVAWLQLMIPMTEQALDLLASAAERAADPEVARFAAETGAGHRIQLRTLRGLLKRSGTPPVNVHEGHDMPGMVTAAELAVLHRAQGAAFDGLFAGHIGEYLRQSVRVARGEQASGADRETRAFAGAVERTRAGELTRLAGLPGASD
ncbi:DUF305 domain-containing protein [Planomonospora sp. ID82291]|uniref:DUF305 domain-containing protein n=1 Tax=Planomonospora sp. ID82291 TaxID=2738136 RepID=UPI0018C3DE95|nr:DUF305 domain-containing protein [Planomonospora sp. ID82291]MBG0814145.1 DUF305 domain-containing protein [Planomonospora sp. ID82291]